MLALKKLIRPVQRVVNRPHWSEVFSNLPRVDVEMTPDMAELEEHEWCLVFVYDDMKRDGTFHHLINVDYTLDFGRAYSKSLFQTITKNNGMFSYPIPLENRPFRARWDEGDVHLPPNYRIRGELYAIRPYQMRHLDMHKGNGVQFVRRRVDLIYPYRQKLQNKKTGEIKMTGEMTYIIRAWMYVAISDYWLPTIRDNEHTADRFITTHFHFNKQEPKLWKRGFYDFDVNAVKTWAHPELDVLQPEELKRRVISTVDNGHAIEFSYEVPAEAVPF